MPFSTLNVDVLGAILFWLFQENLVNLMGTCRGMYNIALPYLLSSVECRLCRLPEFVAFVLMEKHGGGALLLLRSLTIHRAVGDTPSEQTPDLQSGLGRGLLTGILQGARNLRTLNALYLLTAEEEPGVFDVIASLPHLSKVTIPYTDDPWLSTLSRTRVRHVDVRPSEGLAHVIQSMPETLEVLVFRRPSGIFQRVLLDGGFQIANEWPLVHTLRIQWLTVSPSYLARWFPNLRTLVIDQILEANYTESPIHTLWPRLEYFGTTTTTFRDLGVSCPIRDLYISSKFNLSPYGNACPVLEILGHIGAASPRALSIAGVHDPSVFLPQLTVTLPDLRVLGLSLCSEPDGIVEKMAVILNLLRPLPLAYMTIEYAPQFAKITEKELLDCLLPVFLTPTIRILEITMNGALPYETLVREDGHHSWWELSDVGEDGGPRRVKRISAAVGQQLRNMMIAGHDYV